MRSNDPVHLLLLQGNVNSQISGVFSQVVTVVLKGTMAVILGGWHSTMGGSLNTVSVRPVYPQDELRTDKYLAITSPYVNGTEEAGQCLSSENVLHETRHRPVTGVHQGAWEYSLRETEA